VFLLGIGESIISNVWYVPSFKKTLLSLILICQSGHQIVIEDGVIKINSIKDNYKTMMIGYEDGKLLIMKGTIIPRMKYFAGLVEIGITPIRLWHVHFGHLNVDSLIQLQQQGMVKGFPTFRRKMQDAKLAFMENIEGYHLPQELGGKCYNLFTLIFVDLWTIHSMGEESVFYYLLITSVGWFGCIF
jgi:hypothetical protein